MTFAMRAAGVLMLIVTFAGCGGQDGGRPAPATSTTDTTTVAIDTTSVTDESLYEVLRSDSRFSTFLGAIEAADLTETFSGPGPFTVFAPANQSFERPGSDIGTLLEEDNQDELRDLVLDHVANGEIMASALSGQTLRALSGGDLVISGSGDSLRVGDAPIVEADIPAENGVIHVVGDVLSPSMEL